MVIAVLDETRETVMHLGSYLRHCLMIRGARIGDEWMGSLACRSILSRRGHLTPFEVGAIWILGRDKMHHDRDLGVRISFWIDSLCWSKREKKLQKVKSD